METTARAQPDSEAVEPGRLELDLPQFQGPLDLLLHLIQKNDLDIHEISIARITDQYLAYIDVMKMLDLDVASEYLVMASTLLYLKSQSMLPAAKSARRGPDANQTREELVRQLLEYKRFKEAAMYLHEAEEARSTLHTRPTDDSFDDGETREYRVEATLFDLISAFKTMLEHEPVFESDFPDEIGHDPVTVEQKIRELLARVEDGETIEFGDLFSRFESRLEMICTFLAILELARTRQVFALQEEPYGPIRVELNPDRPDVTTWQWTRYDGPEEVPTDH